jgi:hypothetical protein
VLCGSTDNYSKRLHCYCCVLLHAVQQLREAAETAAMSAEELVSVKTELAACTAQLEQVYTTV